MKAPLSLFLMLIAAACAGPPAAAPVSPTEPATTPTPTGVIAAAATATLTPSATPEPTATPRPTATPTIAPTPHPLAWATIEALRQRQYGGSGIEVLETLGSNESFTRHLIEFPSDGLAVQGFMNVPHGQGPFPVIVTLHGYVNPATYQTLAYTTSYADAYARAGFLVLHPDLRNHGQSDPGPNAFRSGYVIDVLNLLHQLDSIPEADPERVGLWGHSMGGGITIKALTVTDRVGAAVLYGSMSADEQANYQRILFFTGGLRAGSEQLPVSPEDDPGLYEKLSAIHHLETVQTPVQLHHGTADEQVPVAWSEDLARRLTSAELFLYPGQPHSLQGDARALFNQRVIEFFRRHLGAGA